MAGQEYLSNDDEDEAKKAFAKATKLDPSNSKARTQLKKLEAPAKTAAAPKRSIDNAFGDEEEEAPRAKKKPARKAAARTSTKDRAAAIDEAFSKSAEPACGQTTGLRSGVLTRILHP